MSFCSRREYPFKNLKVEIKKNNVKLSEITGIKIAED